MDNVIYIVTFKSQSTKRIERVCFKKFSDAQAYANERNGKIDTMIVH